MEKTIDKPVEKKKRKNSKNKGNGFENVVAKTLSAALNPLKFIRTQGSGARVGGKNFDTIGQMFGEDALKLFVGDVVPVNEKEAKVSFNYSVECKFYSTSDSFTSLVAGSANIFKWFAESVHDAQKINKKPMVICKWNHTPIFAIVNAKDHSAIMSLLKVGPQLTIRKNSEHDLLVFELEKLLETPEWWVTQS